MPEHPLDECPNAIAPLWRCNQEVVAIYQQIAAQFVVDLHVGSVVFERLTQGCGQDETRTLLDQLALIHATTATRREPDG